MNSKDVHLIITFVLDNGKSIDFKEDTTKLISLEEIKKKVMANIQKEEHYSNSFKLTNQKGEVMEENLDLIKNSIENEDGDLICKITLKSDNQNENLNGQSSQKTNGKINISDDNNNKIEVQKTEENSYKGEDKKDIISPNNDQNNDNNIITENSNTISGQSFTDKKVTSINGDTPPESQIKKNKESQKSSEPNGVNNIGETPIPEGEKDLKKENESISSKITTITQSEIEIQSKKKNSSSIQNEKNSILTDTEKRINEAKNTEDINVNSNKSDTNQEKVQGGDTINNIQNSLDNNQGKEGIVNPTDYEKIKEENEKIKEENEKLKEENEKIKELEKIKEENEKLKKENENLKKDNEKLKELEKIKEENEKIKKQNEELKAEKDKIENQRNNISKELNDKAEEFNNIEEKYKANIKKLEEENSMLKKHYEELGKKIEEEAQIPEYKKQVENLKLKKN